MKKKLLALLLCVLMTVALLPSLTAAENDGTEEESPEIVILDEETPESFVPEEETPEAEQPESELLPENAAPIDVQKPEDNGSRQDIVDSGMLQMGTNTFVISNGGDRLFKWFVAPASGKFRIFSYGNFDTVGNINGGSVSAENDDGGTSTNFLLECTLERGEWYMVGAWFYTSTTTGTINVMIDFVSDPLQVGSNTFAITYDGEEVCRSFTASNSGEYRFYDTCSYGYLNYRLLNDKMITLDTQSEYTAYNFDIRYMLNAGQTVYLAVSPAEVNTGNFSAYNVNVNIEYSGSSATPTPTPTPTPSPTPTPTPTPVSSFSGTVEWNKNDVLLKNKTVYTVYNGNAQTPRFTLKDQNGATVPASCYTYWFQENTQPGTAYLFVNFTNTYSGTYYTSFKIYLPASTSLEVKNMQAGIRLTWTAVEGAAGYVIYRRAWSTTTNGWTDFARWDNTTLTSYLDGANDAHKVYAGTRYQYGVKAYFARRTDPVTGSEIGGNVNDPSGNYNLGLVSPLKTTVRITNRRLTELVPGTTQMTAKWEGSKNFTGYQVQIATDFAFTKNVKTVKITNADTASTVIKSLSKATTYYARVRSYHDFEGMTYYGDWSNILNCRTGSAYASTLSVRRAVLVGEAAYTTANPLRGPVNDANSFAGALRGLKYSFSTKVLPNSTKEEILSAIASTFASATDDDVSLFFYSGHGLNYIGSNQDTYNRYQGALCAIDGTYLTFTELAEAFKDVKGKVIFIFSCCHSGASINRSAGDEDEIDEFLNAAIRDLTGYDPEDGARLGELRQSRFTVIAAASMNESGWDGKFDGSGYFQGALVAALVKGLACKYPNGAYSGSTMPADANKNNAVTLKEMYNYAYKQAYNWTNVAGTNYTPQHAQYYGTDSFVLFKR